MKKHHLLHEQVIVLIFLILIGSFFFIRAFSYGNVKLFPIITSSIVLVCSFASLPNAIRLNKEMNRKIDEDPEYVAEMSWARLSNPLIGYLLIMVYAIAIPTIGFFVSTGAFMIGLMLYLGYKKWYITILITVGIELGIYFLFVKELMVRIPHGILY